MGGVITPLNALRRALGVVCATKRGPGHVAGAPLVLPVNRRNTALRPTGLVAS